MKRLTVATLISIIVSIALGLLFVALARGFGAGDLIPFAFWTLLLSLTIGIGTLPLARLTRGWIPGVRLGVAGLYGLYAVIFWEYVTSWYLGDWIRAFSFSTFIPWMIAGLSGILGSFLIVPVLDEVPNQKQGLRMALSLGLTMLIPPASAIGFLGAWILFMTLYRNAVIETEVILVPQGYSGTVLIFHNDPNGQPVKYDNGRRTYEIPSDGIYSTSAPEPPSYTWEFWYVDREGRRARIPNQPNCPDQKDLERIVVCHAIASVSKHEGNNSYWYSIDGYIIGQMKEYDLFYRTLEKEANYESWRLEVR